MRALRWAAPAPLCRILGRAPGRTRQDPTPRCGRIPSGDRQLGRACDGRGPAIPGKRQQPYVPEPFLLGVGRNTRTVSANCAGGNAFGVRHLGAWGRALDSTPCWPACQTTRPFRSATPSPVVWQGLVVSGRERLQPTGATAKPCSPCVRPREAIPFALGQVPASQPLGEAPSVGE